MGKWLIWCPHYSIILIISFCTMHTQRLQLSLEQLQHMHYYGRNRMGQIFYQAFMGRFGAESILGRVCAVGRSWALAMLGYPPSPAVERPGMGSHGACRACGPNLLIGLWWAQYTEWAVRVLCRTGLDLPMYSISVAYRFPYLNQTVKKRLRWLLVIKI